MLNGNGQDATEYEDRYISLRTWSMDETWERWGPGYDRGRRIEGRLGKYTVCGFLHTAFKSRGECTFLMDLWPTYDLCDWTNTVRLVRA